MLGKVLAGLGRLRKRNDREWAQLKLSQCEGTTIASGDKDPR